MKSEEIDLVVNTSYKEDGKIKSMIKSIGQGRYSFSTFESQYSRYRFNFTREELIEALRLLDDPIKVIDREKLENL